MCSVIQVFLLFPSCSVGDIILCGLFCVAKMNQHYIPLLSNGLFLGIVYWMYIALMEPSWLRKISFFF